MRPLLAVDGLTKHFPLRGGLLNRTKAVVQAVDDVSFEVGAGETLGIVGESGCGKSTTARLLMHLVPLDHGTIAFDGKAVGAGAGLSRRDLHRQMQMVFQDSYASLNPRLPVAMSIAFGPLVHGLAKSASLARARDLLQAVGLDPMLFANRYPHELSGGQRQRINVARALALEPRLVILDEAVSALDKSIEAQVLNLLIDIKERFDLTYIFISHDLNVVRFISDRVLVMYLGKVVELGPVDRIYREPRHPYTKALLSAMPSMDPRRRTMDAPLSGDPPNPINPPSGCRFRTRCPFAEAVCADVPPTLTMGHDGRAVACHMLVSGAQPRVSSMVPVVSVEGLRVRFTTPDATVSAVNGVDFALDPGRVLGILGESGSGKTVTLRALIGLLPRGHSHVEGRITVAGHEITKMSEAELREVRGTKIAMIFQEPMTALDPVFTIGEQIAETIVRHEGVSRADAYRRALDLLEMVQIPSAARRLKSYPHEMSGGMRQRAMIAVALSCRPAVLLADEPTTALDVTVQIQIIVLLRQLQRELGMAVVFVTHDVGVAVEVADRIAVMYAGRFVETGPTETVICSPAHPYTAGLLASTVLGAAQGQRLDTIPGTPPDMTSLPPGCSFAPRCRFAETGCHHALPPEFALASDHAVRCLRVAAGEIAVAEP